MQDSLYFKSVKVHLNYIIIILNVHNFLIQNPVLNLQEFNMKLIYLEEQFMKW